MGLRELIEGKQRRTAKLPILVGDPSAAAAEVDTFRSALAVHLAEVEMKKGAGKRPSKADGEREQQLRDDLKAAQDRMAATVVEVEVQSLSDDEWEAALAGLPDDDRENFELDAIHAPLLAASCTDPELQDADWWAAQLKGEAWTDGDKAVISQTLLQLNVLAPRFEALGKD